MDYITHIVLLLVALETQGIRLKEQVAHLRSETLQPADQIAAAIERRTQFANLLTDDAFVGVHPEDDWSLFKLSIDSLDTALGCDLRGSRPLSQAPNNIFVKITGNRTLDEDPPFFVEVYCNDLEGLTSDVGYPERIDIFERDKLGLSMRMYDLTVDADATSGRYQGDIEKVEGVCPFKGNGIMRLADSLLKCLRHERGCLGDASQLKCVGGGNFKLGLLSSMQSGMTWYQKYGFEYHFEDSRILHKIQQDLKKLTVEDLKAAVSKCGVAVLPSPNNPLHTNMSAVVLQRFAEYDVEGSTFESERCQKGSAGHFAEWLIKKDCKSAETTIRAALPLPCPSMAQENKGSSLWSAAKLPTLSGLMFKNYIDS